MLGDARANDTVTMTPTPQQVGCGAVQDVIHLFVVGPGGRTAYAAPVTITIDRECIQ